MNIIGESLLQKLSRECLSATGQGLIKHQVMQACGCIGPQCGEPMCPCSMRAQNVVKRDGRWIRLECDLGPAT